MDLFFDLDHTLWDFDSNAEECLLEIFEEFLPDKSAHSTVFIEKFNTINKAMWLLLERNEITHEYLRKNRFKNTFEAINLQISDTQGEQMNERFLELLPHKTGLVKHALEILEYLKPKHTLHILSNGFCEIQTRKINNSGLAPYFNELITVDVAGARKPDPAIFDYAVKKSGAKLSDSMMIGDSFEADIMGAERYGLEAIYFAKENQQDHPRFINSLDQLKNYF